MKNTLIVLLAFLIISCSSNNDKIIGERIDGPANIRESENGKVLFTLNDNVLVECTEPTNGWYVVGTEVELSKEEEKSFKIKKGTQLRDLDGNIIGESKNDINLGMTGEEDGKLTGFIAGLTFKKNIKTTSIAENILGNIINQKGRQIHKDDLMDFIKSFNFEMEDDGNAFFIYENSIDDMSPRDRITLMFQNDKLKGIIHSRKLPIKGFKTYELVRGHKFTPIENLTNSEIKKIISEKIEFYNSID